MRRGQFYWGLVLGGTAVLGFAGSVTFIIVSIYALLMAYFFASSEYATVLNDVSFTGLVIELWILFMSEFGGRIFLYALALGIGAGLTLGGLIGLLIGIGKRTNSGKNMPG